MKKLEKPEDRMKAVNASAEQFLTAIRKALALQDDQALWFAPGQLLIYTDAKTHAAAAKLFANLADPRAALAGDLAKLQNLTAARAAESKDARARRLEALEKARLLLSLHSSSWQLLAAAAGGELDLETLTELQVAWKHPQMTEILRGSEALTALRSLWALAESSRALPKQTELGALARVAAEKARPAADDAVATLAKSPENLDAFFRTLYAALAFDDDKGFRQRAEGPLHLLAAPRPKLQGADTLAAALLARPVKPDAYAEGVAAYLREQSDDIRGEDLVVLAALACRRSGGEAWSAFRAEAADLLGRQPLSGSVVVLVNRLSRAQLPLLAVAVK
jgi:hypothetical protein